MKPVTSGKWLHLCQLRFPRVWKGWTLCSVLPAGMLGVPGIRYTVSTWDLSGRTLSTSLTPTDRAARIWHRSKYWAFLVPHMEENNAPFASHLHHLPFQGEGEHPCRQCRGSGKRWCIPGTWCWNKAWELASQERVRHGQATPVFSLCTQHQVIPSQSQPPRPHKERK